LTGAFPPPRTSGSVGSDEITLRKDPHVSEQSTVALITGGNRGLGRSTAQHLAARGVDVVITYRSNAAEADAAVSALTAHGRRAAALRLDVGQIGSFDAFAEDLRRVLAERWGRTDLDFLVNNAGIGSYAPFADTTEKDFDELLNVHFKGVFFLTQKLLPLIVDGGRIVNLSTGLTRFVGAPTAAYASMKGAIEVLTRYLAQELGGRGITVNAVAPGPTGTDFGGGGLRDDEQMRARLAANTALGRVGEPDDIGGAIASLLTGENSWITGQRIEGSGGTRL
jgi:NAD(P)-dependent dehydrogenase (short-subunit alcohol dehydrogenase family)